MKSLFRTFIIGCILVNLTGCAPALHRYMIESEPPGGVVVVRNRVPSDTTIVQQVGMTPIEWSFPKVDSLKFEIYKRGYEKATTLCLKDTISDSTRLSFTLRPVADPSTITAIPSPKRVLLCAPDFSVKTLMVGGGSKISPEITYEVLQPMLDVVTNYLTDRGYTIVQWDTTVLNQEVKKCLMGCKKQNPYLLTGIPAVYGNPPQLSGIEEQSALAVLQVSLHIDGIILLDGRVTVESGSRKFLKTAGGLALSAVGGALIGTAIGPMYMAGSFSSYLVPVMEFPVVEGAFLELTFLDAKTSEYLWLNHTTTQGNLKKDKLAAEASSTLITCFPPCSKVQNSQEHDFENKMVGTTRNVVMPGDKLEMKISGMQKNEIIDCLNNFAISKKYKVRKMSDSQVLCDMWAAFPYTILVDIIQIDSSEHALMLNPIGAPALKKIDCQTTKRFMNQFREYLMTIDQSVNKSN